MAEDAFKENGEKMTKILIIASLLFLTACGANTQQRDFEIPRTVETITSVAYPVFPDISIPPQPNLIPWEYDFPRDPDADPVIKNVSSCIDVPEENQDEAFWARCGEQPIQTDSNIFIGMDQDNWNILNRNLEVLKENNFQLRERLDIANEQRQRWREMDEAERERIRSLTNPSE